MNEVSLEVMVNVLGSGRSEVEKLKINAVILGSSLEKLSGNWLARAS